MYSSGARVETGIGMEVDQILGHYSSKRFDHNTMLLELLLLISRRGYAGLEVVLVMVSKDINDELFTCARPKRTRFMRSNVSYEIGVMTRLVVDRAYAMLLTYSKFKSPAE